MEVVHDLGQVLLGLVLAGHVRKADAVRGLDVDAGVGLAHPEGHAVLAAHLLHHLFAHVLSQADEDDQRQHERQQKAQNGRALVADAVKGRAGLVQPLGQGGVVHGPGLVDLGVVLVGKGDLGAGDFHHADILFLDHIHEGAVVHLVDLGPHQHGRHDQIEQAQDGQHQNIVVDQRLFGAFDFFHRLSPPLGVKRAELYATVQSAYELSITPLCGTRVYKLLRM